MLCCLHRYFNRVCFICQSIFFVPDSGIYAIYHVITSNESRTVTMSLFDYSVIASFALPNEYSRIGVHDSTLFDQATFLESSSPSPTNPANLVHPLVSLVSRMHLGLEVQSII